MLIGIAVVAVAASIVRAGPPIIVVGTWDETTCGTGADVWGSGDVAYWAHFGEPCVDILDVSDPFAPQWLGSYQVPPPDQFVSAQDIKVHGGLAFVAHEGGGFNAASIVDVRDPTDPVQLTTLRIEVDGDVYTSCHNLFYHEGYLYMADSGTRTVVIVDLTKYDPDNAPSHISEAKWRLTGVGTAFVHDITVQGNRMYVSAWDDLIVYDITQIDTHPPVRIGSAPGDSVHASWATDDGRFIAVTEERPGGGLKLYEAIETDNVLTLTLRDETVEPPPTFSAHNPLIAGDRIYTAWYGSGLIVHRIDRVNGRLVEIGRIAPGSTWGVYPFLGPDRVLLGGFDYFAVADATLCAAVTPDADGDGDVDFADFGAFQRCAPNGGPGCAEAFDADCDGLINVFDFESLLSATTGPVAGN